jgi:hypothetical protein
MDLQLTLCVAHETFSHTVKFFFIAVAVHGTEVTLQNYDCCTQHKKNVQ